MQRLSHVRRYLIAGILLCGVLLSGYTVSAQDNRSLRWDRWDVTIDKMVTQDNQFDVTENYVIAVTQGPFRFGTRNIPLNRITRIEGLQVSEGGVALRGDCSGSAGTFCGAISGGEYQIRYEFRSPANSGARRSFRIKYTVRGALRSYPGGDQLWWNALAPDRPFSVIDSTVTLTLPADRPLIKAASYPDTWAQSVSGNTITWEAPGNLGKGGTVEVRVQYPHDERMPVSSWQADFDRNQALEETLRPILGILSLILTALFGIGGPLFAYIQYAQRGRDPEAVVVPEYLTEPPSDELPGVVGTLLDEKADMQDIMATLIDLARRGFIVIEQTKRGGLGGLFGGTDFTFHRLSQPDQKLRRVEQLLLSGVFSGYGSQVELSELRNKFYTKIPGIKRELYTELVRNGYFKRSPETTRSMWIGISIGVLVVAGLIGFGAYSLLWRFTPLSILPAIGLGITGIVLLIFASYMPAKTPKGSQEAARWRAFRQYLKNIKKYTDVQQASDQFEKYIGYAVAFGLDSQWIRDFAPALTSMPTWYYPTYIGGPWHRGYYGHGAAPDFSGSSMGGGFGDLNSMSQSLTEGLNAMSSGLTQMLNDASRVMTSQPSSSGGGGGWSGGGSSGGGSSGGGSAGFG
ncbi:MAG: DUF2207 domain-containing protein [Anaerolineae bacterium]|nr:DUF2207 domain-containing protein [Anaerolineae bacterium]